ncbi:unnamed protein product [Amaranthus hypochondriacus]
MFRVDVENILRQYSNAYHAQTHYPNPLDDVDFEHDDFASDEFRMYSFKIKKCPLNRSHDWTICPYAHHGERARRRDLNKVPYVAVSCPHYRGSSGNCPRGELCEFAHGVFEYWLHPTKYRTRVCNLGGQCTRPVCFFAHSPKELRREAIAHVPKWVRLSLHEKAEAKTSESLFTTSNSSQTKNTNTLNCNTSSVALELGAIGRSRKSNAPTSWELSCNNTNTNIVTFTPQERPQELKLEFLESLRMLSIGNNYYNNQVLVQNNNVDLTKLKSDHAVFADFDWVSDLVSG